MRCSSDCPLATALDSCPSASPAGASSLEVRAPFARCLLTARPWRPAFAAGADVGGPPIPFAPGIRAHFDTGEWKPPATRASTVERRADAVSVVWLRVVGAWRMGGAGQRAGKHRGAFGRL